MTKKKVRKIKGAAKTGSKNKAVLTDRANEVGASPIQSEKAGTVVTTQSKFQAFKQYLKDVRAEFDKISWATQKETVSMTIAVLAISIFFSAYLGLVDIILSKLVGILMD